MNERIAVEIVCSKQALDRPRTVDTARLWVGETEEGQIQIAFLGPDPDGAPLLSESADRAAEQFHEAYMMQALMNGDDSAETQIRETRRFWAELLTCRESWQCPAPGTETTGVNSPLGKSVS